MKHRISWMNRQTSLFCPCISWAVLLFKQIVLWTYWRGGFSSPPCLLSSISLAAHCLKVLHTWSAPFGMDILVLSPIPGIWRSKARLYIHTIFWLSDILEMLINYWIDENTNIVLSFHYHIYYCWYCSRLLFKFYLWCTECSYD